jgi:hypothetical protein
LVPTDVIAIYLDGLHEGLICALTHYLVTPWLPVLNMVDAPLMIVFTDATIVGPLYISEGSFCK